MSSFVHLHVHSHYSLLDGLPKVTELIAAAKEQGFKAMALTDYGSLYGAIEFYEAAGRAGFKPIIGMEAFVAPNGRFSKQTKTDARADHLVLLARDAVGYKNLMKLSSRGHLEGFYYRPRIDEDLLIELHEGLIALSGCSQGRIARALLAGDTNAARHTAQKYAALFGAEGFFLELQDHPELEGQTTLNIALADLGRVTGLPVVATRDVHYINKGDGAAQDLLVCIREGKTVEQPGRFSMRHVDRSLCSAQDIASRFSHIPQAIANTVRIAEMVNLEISLNQWHFPPIDIPEGTTADQVLRNHSFAGIAEKLEVTPEITERMEYELSIIAEKGYAPYFLVVADLIGYARQSGIMVTTRGSAAGSLVSYAVGIVNVNPLYFKLPFERFLNPFRPSPPDIDMDFADDRRDEMIAYATQKYGQDSVAQIITFGTMMARGSVRDTGRALGLSYGFCDQVSKLIPFGAQGFPMTIKRALKEEPDLKKLYEQDRQVRELLDLAQKIEGCVRHTSIHAAGVVIAPTALTDFTPVQRESGGERITTQYDMHSVEAAGLLKMDFLGIRNLSILGHAVEFVAKTEGKTVDIEKIPWDDAAVYAMLARGETMGVFQMGSSGMTRYLKELKPTDIFDIMAMVALFRPGPMESIPEYITRKHNPSLAEYLDPRLEHILARTYGVITYQDDVLLIAIELAGYDWEQADKFRKAIGKKIPEEMAKQKIKFFQGCRAHGRLPEEKIQRLWNLIEPFAAYGFNKAHAASYAVVAYQTAYMKANYPVQFMTAVLTAEAQNTDKVAGIVHECGRMGIRVLPPDVNESFRNFAMIPVAKGEAPRIRFGLTAIKNMGDHIAGVIYQERKRGGAYATLEDFLTRIGDKDLNKKSLESLIKCGALDCFGSARSLLLYNIDVLIQFHRQVRQEALAGQDSLFGQGLSRPHLRLAPSPPPNPHEELVWEKELLGLYVTAHPFEKIAQSMGDSITPLSKASVAPPDTWVFCGGIIGAVERKTTKRGGIMLFVTLEDRSGSVECLVFPKVLEQTQDAWVTGAHVCVMARKPPQAGDLKLFAEKVFPVTKENASKTAAYLRSIAGQHHIGAKEQLATGDTEVRDDSVIITVRAALGERRNALKDIFLQNPGNRRVMFRVLGGGKESMVETPFCVDWERIRASVAHVLDDPIKKTDL